MPEYIEKFNQLVSLGVILLQVVCIVLVACMLFVKDRHNKVRKFFSDYAFYFGFLISLGAVALSLFYSDVIGFPPCDLCWIQRIFIYPQLILFAMELYKRDKTILDFSIAFAFIALIVAFYHVYIELGGQASYLPCDANGVSCATKYVLEFSYITIPMMSLTVSLSILLLMVNYKYMQKIK